MLKAASTLKLFCFLLLCTGLASCNEETVEPEGGGSISGVVIHAETEAPISGVSISTKPATAAVITNQEGNFSIPEVDAGEYNVVAQKLGYKVKGVTVAVKSFKSSHVTIVLEEATGGGLAPGKATNPVPASGTTSQPTDVTLRWKAPKSNSGDTLSYDVYLYESGNTEKKLIAEAISDTSVVAKNLKYNTTYFWQVVVRDASSRTSNGDVWSFTTLALTNARYLFARAIEGDYNIYRSDGTEANTFRLTSGVSRDWWPLLNPKRDVIAYSSNETIEPQIYTMNLDGTSRLQITTVPVAGYHNQGIGFVWSPDGGQLIYPHYDKLYRIERDGSGLTVLATAPEGRHFRMLEWTDRGNKILAQTIGQNINDSEIYIMDSNGANMTLLVENLPGRVESPVFSIDGRSILYTQDAAGFENTEGRQLNSRIYRKDLNTNRMTDLSGGKPAGTNDLYPRYSPTGDKIIFVNTPNDGFGPFDIYVMDTNGSNRTKIFSNGTMPDWK
ncbi:carboxypeptidase-like regulatory domain-containing protein [Pontibacter flavimaris]|uniref:Fibronectin type-III domain-containing protein n=1 Tax=Pontibacter flavimaris TaxID=1797110 RepID=A0A1Q5P9C6_9BACT|nr:carboxypeptidase-like regulatory domain-containing protein [Pontibacter flavimaris]OKL38845.1 hypothetical protein A3841_04775 [Pontibacter flavimaris]